MLFKQEELLDVSPVAIELFSAVWCNLDCVYCYIPKSDDFLLPSHKKLVNEIENHPEKIIDRIKRIYPQEKVEIISHWGSEPSLTLHKFKNFYNLALKEFPNLNTISFSSNFMTNTDKVIDFIINFPDDRKMKFQIQMSLDGPSWITDNNRRQGSTEKIINNIYKFYESINERKDLKHEINTHFKPTLPKQYFKDMKDKKLDEYYVFFNDILQNLRDRNTNNKINTLEQSIHFTVVCPQDYTKQDGKEFASLVRRLNLLRQRKKYKYVQPECSYYSHLVRLYRYGNEFFTKQKMFTCSAGDSQFGLSDTLQPCHDTFYINLPGFKDAILQDTDRLHDEEDLIKNGSIDIAKNVLIQKLNDNNKIIQYMYRMRAFHDFVQHKLNFAVGMIKLMAEASQVSEIYKNEEWAKLLAIYCISRHSCPTQNQVYFGSMHINHPGYYKLFGNGALEEFVETLYKNMGD